MLNDALKNQILPWQEKGRWYHAFVESDGSSPTITTCDLDGCSMNASAFLLPEDYELIDYKFVDYDLAASKTIQLALKCSSANRKYFSVPSLSDFTYCDIWFYAYKKSE